MLTGSLKALLQEDTLGLTPLPRGLKPELTMFLTEEVPHWRCQSLDWSVTPSLEMSLTGGGAL